MLEALGKKLPAVFIGSAGEKMAQLKKRFLLKALGDSKEVGVFTFLLMRQEWTIKKETTVSRCSNVARLSASK